MKVTLSATDATSGVAHTFYSIDGGGFATYGAAFTISALGTHTVRYYSKDVAGNASAVKSVSFTISSLTTTKLTARTESLAVYGSQSPSRPPSLPALARNPDRLGAFMSFGLPSWATSTLARQCRQTCPLITVGCQNRHHHRDVWWQHRLSSPALPRLSQVVNKASTTAALAASRQPLEVRPTRHLYGYPTPSIRRNAATER